MPLQLFLDKVLRACRVDFRSALQEDVFQLFGTNVADACLSGSAPHKTHWYVWDAYRYTRFFFFLCVGTMEVSMSMVRREVEKPILCRAPLCETYQFGMASLICSLYISNDGNTQRKTCFFSLHPSEGLCAINAPRRKKVPGNERCQLVAPCIPAPAPFFGFLWM